MKKATLTITMMIEETPDNMEALEELKESVNTGDISAEFAENTEGVSVEATLVIEDV